MPVLFTSLCFLGSLSSIVPFQKATCILAFCFPLSTTHLGENHVHHGDWQISNDIITLEEYKRVTVGKMTHVFMPYLSPS